MARPRGKNLPTAGSRKAEEATPKKKKAGTKSEDELRKNKMKGRTRSVIPDDNKADKTLKESTSAILVTQDNSTKDIDDDKNEDCPMLPDIDPEADLIIKPTDPYNWQHLLVSLDLEKVNKFIQRGQLFQFIAKDITAENPQTMWLGRNGSPISIVGPLDWDEKRGIASGKNGTTPFKIDPDQPNQSVSYTTIQYPDMPVTDHNIFEHNVPTSVGKLMDEFFAPSSTHPAIVDKWHGAMDGVKFSYKNLLEFREGEYIRPSTAYLILVWLNHNNLL